MFVNQPLPAGTATGDEFARELALLLGPAYQPAEGTLIAEDLHTLGDALGDVYATQTRALDQAFTNTATEMLPEWETRLGLSVDPGATQAARQAAATAKRRATGGNSALRVLAILHAFDATATIAVNSALAVATTAGSGATPFPRAVFHWVAVLSAAVWNDAPTRRQVERVVAQVKPAYTRARVVSNATGRFDDAASLADRDAFGV